MEKQDVNGLNILSEVCEDAQSSVSVSYTKAFYAHAFFFNALFPLHTIVLLSTRRRLQGGLYANETVKQVGNASPLPQRFPGMRWPALI